MCSIVVLDHIDTHSGSKLGISTSTFEQLWELYSTPRHSYAQHFCIQLSHYTGEGFRKNYEGSLHHVLHHGRHQHPLVKDLTLTTTTNPKHFSQILGYPKNINKSAEGHSKHILKFEIRWKSGGHIFGHIF